MIGTIQDYRDSLIGVPMCKPRGATGSVLISTPFDSDRVVEREMVMCCHCGGHWLWVKGSGRRRGWCMRCSGCTCGQRACDACVPMERQIENMEAGRDRLSMPIWAAMPKEVSAGGILLG